MQEHSRPLRVITALALLALPPILALVMRENGILLNRPVREHIERQLLVIGLPGSGTSAMAHDLAELGLRIGHEDARQDDGSVSWLHGMRLLESIDIKALCRRDALTAGWHPMKLESHQCKDACRLGCWNTCWEKECPGVLRRQVSCYGNQRDRCRPRFRVTLLQVRHPLSATASVVHGFCGGNLTADATHNKLLHLFRAFFPTYHWADVPTCAGQVAAFWLQYNRVALQRADHWYRVEDTTPCAVAKLAGIDAVRPHVAAKCRKAPQQPAAVGLVMNASRAHGHDARHDARKNVKRVELTYEALAKVAGQGVVDELQKLAVRLGYVDP